MVELQHRDPEPAALVEFRRAYPNASVADFDSLAFRPVKQAVKEALNEDQGGLCVYCERLLASTVGQVDHILPKGGPNAHAALCYQYRNYAHSCIDNATCGQKKKHGLLPIKPGPGCNAEWTLSLSSGEIVPLGGLSRQRHHAVKMTRDMLGLNTSALARERKLWLDVALTVLQESPDQLPDFIATAPFRYLLSGLFETTRPG